MTKAKLEYDQMIIELCANSISSSKIGRMVGMTCQGVLGALRRHGQTIRPVLDRVLD
jgi:hypothetical protein